MIWGEFDLEKEEDLEEVYQFLKENYVEDSTGTYRLEYTKELLKWVLFKPNWRKDWHFCIRKDKKLIGMNTLTPMTLMINSKKLEPHGIANLLCVNREYRD